MAFDNLENDLWEQAGFTKSSAAPPPSIRKGRASIFDDDPEELALDALNPATEVKMIRGRPIKMQRDVRPGGLEALHKTQESIRRVCGAGFSNEVIEKYIKVNQQNEASGSSQESSSTRVHMPDLSFQRLSYPHHSEQNGNNTDDNTNFKLNNDNDFPALKK